MVWGRGVAAGEEEVGAAEGEGGLGGQLVCWCGVWADCVRRPALRGTAESDGG